MQELSCLRPSDRARTANLVCAIDRSRRHNLKSANGTDVDDLTAALALHHGQDCSNAPEHAFDVHINHPLPFILLARRHWGQGHDAGVVDKHVNASPGVYRRLNEGMHGLAIGDV